MDRMTELMESIKQLQREKDNLLRQLECSVALKKLAKGHDVTWPMFTSIQTNGDNIHFKVRDSDKLTLFIPLKDMPPCFMSRPHIVNALRHLRDMRNKQATLYLKSIRERKTNET